MITIKRSKVIQNDVAWVVHSMDEPTRRCKQLYLGFNVNEAIEAAKLAGMDHDKAVAMAKSEVARSQQVVDEIQ